MRGQFNKIKKEEDFPGFINEMSPTADFKNTDILIAQENAELTEAIVLFKTLRQNNLSVEYIGEIHGQLSAPVSNDIILPTLIFIKDTSLDILVGLLSAYLFDKFKTRRNANIKSRIKIKKGEVLMTYEYDGPAETYINALRHLLRKPKSDK